MMSLPRLSKTSTFQTGWPFSPSKDELGGGFEGSVFWISSLFRLRIRSIVAVDQSDCFSASVLSCLFKVTHLSGDRVGSAGGKPWLCFVAFRRVEEG